MGKKSSQSAAFHLQGRFLSFEVEDGYKIKRLNLATAEGEVQIKLSKSARASVQGVLTPGDWIWVFGEQYTSDMTVKYKAHLIKQTAPGTTPALSAPEPTATQPTKAKPQVTILVCQKSDCMKRGGKAVCQRLQQELRDRGLTDQVTIKGVGCMKECKAGPNMVVMPDKTRYSRIQASQVTEVIDRHFGQPVPTSSEVRPLG